MKKFFLMLAAGLLASSASAQKLVYEIDYTTTDWKFYVMGYTPEKGEEGIVSNNPMEGDDGGPSWYQYFIADGVPTKVDESYTVVVNCKASEDVNLGMNMGWGWGEGEVINGTLPISTDWAEVEVDFKKPVGGTSCNVVLQPGTSTATIYIKSVKVYQNPPAAQYTTEDVATVDYSKLAEYPYEEFGAKPVIADGVLSFPAEGEMFYAMDQVTFVPDSLYGVKAKIKGEKAGTIRVSLGYDGEVKESADLEVSEDWEEVELPVGVVIKDGGNTATDGFVLILTKDEEAGLNYDGALQLEYCTLATFTEIPPVVIPTEWVSIVGNCNANDGESKNLIDRNPSIEGPLKYTDEYTQEHDAYAYICDNPVASEGGKVYYCPINADPAEAWDSQFFILFDEAVEADTPMKVSFDYYCSDERTIDTQAHGLPGSYQHYVFIGSLKAKPEWQHHSWEGEVSSAQAGANGCWSIAFNLSSAAEAATFYINNVVVQIEKEVAGDPGAVKTVNAVIVPVKGVYNMMGVKVADSLDEVAAPGIYISNGKKYIKK